MEILKIAGPRLKIKFTGIGEIWSTVAMCETKIESESLRMTYYTRAIYMYKVFDLVGHFVLATQGLLGHCTFVMEIMS